MRAFKTHLSVLEKRSVTPLTLALAERATAHMKLNEDQPIGEMTMKKAPDNICPRCGGGVPNDAMQGKYPGALSRTDNMTEICSACGTAEAMEDFYHGMCLQQSAWWATPKKEEVPS